MKATRSLAALSAALLLVGAGCQPVEFFRSIAGQGRGPEPVVTFTTKDKTAGCPAGYRTKCQTEHYLEGSFEYKDVTCENIQAADDEFKKNSSSVCGGAAGAACPRGFWCELGAGTNGACHPLPKRQVGLSNCDPDLPYAADTVLTRFLAEPKPDAESVLVRVRLASSATSSSVAALLSGFKDRQVIESLLKLKAPPDTIAHLDVTRSELRALMASDSVRQVESIQETCGGQGGTCDEGFVCVVVADSQNGAGECRPLAPEQQQKIGRKGDFSQADGPTTLADVEFVAFADRGAVKKVLDSIAFDPGNGVSELILSPLGNTQASRVKITAAQLLSLLDAPEVQSVGLAEPEPPAADGSVRRQHPEECGADQDSGCDSGYICRTLPGRDRGICIKTDKVAFTDLKTQARYLRSGVGVVNIDIYFSAGSAPDEIVKEIQTIRPDWPALSDAVVAGVPRKEVKAMAVTSDDLLKILDLPAVDYVLVNSIL